MIQIVTGYFKHAEKGNSQHHAGYPPYRIADHNAQDGKKRIKVNFAANHHGLEDIALYKLYTAIGNEDARDQAEVSALYQSHTDCYKCAGDVAEKLDQFQNAAKQGEKDGIAYPDEGKANAVHDPKASDHENQPNKYCCATQPASRVSRCTLSRWPCGTPFNKADNR
jgi:hypothetical protein